MVSLTVSERKTQRRQRLHVNILVFELHGAKETGREIQIFHFEYGRPGMLYCAENHPIQEGYRMWNGTVY